jgi:lipopolysaccharide transport system ATP-binding protein
MRRHEITRKLDEIVDFSGCAAYLDTPVKRYSSGMYVRLAFAVAANLEPEILVVDEVLAVGDSDFQKKCLTKMDEVSSQQGRTILFVSHQLGVVSALCKSGLLLTHGQIEQTGLIQQVVETYLDRQNDVSGEIRWSAGQAPRGEHVELKAVRIRSNSGVSSVVSLSEAVNIEVDYFLHRDGPIINVSFHVLDALGNCIMATANLTSSCEFADALGSARLPIGNYRSTCVIPAHFLNDSTYRVSVFGVCNYANIDVQAEECLAFKGHDDGEMRKEYTGKWIGQIRPRLHWNTEKLS